MPSNFHKFQRIHNSKNIAPFIKSHISRVRIINLVFKVKLIFLQGQDSLPSKENVEQLHAISQLSFGYIPNGQLDNCSIQRMLTDQNSILNNVLATLITKHINAHIIDHPTLSLKIIMHLPYQGISKVKRACYHQIF